MVAHNEELRGLELEGFHKATRQLNRITRSLQDLAMSVRMVPIRGTFRRMFRVVRDLEQKQGKQVELVLRGEETEVDRRVVEGIADPLVHLLRNAVDHGLEPPHQRGPKRPRGRVTLEARHESGEVWITVADDGRGLDREAILTRARERGLVAPDQVLSEADVHALIFEPGFSTARVVTDVSGRGVGMDVVKRNVERLRGRIDIVTVPGQGTRFTLRIPLTLAIVEGLLVRVGEQFYTIPLFSIRESVSIGPGDVTTLVDGTEVLNLRGKSVPILRLYQLHGLAHDHEDLTRGVLVIVEDAGQALALFVDELLGQRQTVIKALPAYLGSLPGLAGCSILSDGAISLILDLSTLASPLAAASA